MAEVCANKNSKEWKKLVSQTGDQLANLAFITNGYEIPDVRPATEIKKEISFKTRTENFAGIASKLRRYNQKHGTSHYFTFRPIWGNTFELTMKYNYLPVNIEKQRQRDAAKGDPLYVVNDFDANGFSYMYPTSPTVERVQPALRPIMESQQLDLFSDSDELIKGAEAKLESVEKRRRNKIDSEIIKQREAYKNAKTPDEARSAIDKLERLQELYEEANKRTVLAKNAESFEDFEKFGKAQLKEIRQLLKNPAISADDVYYAEKIINLWIKAGDFSVQPNEHIFLDADEFNSSEDVTLPDGTVVPSIRSRFRTLGNRAQDLQSDLNAIRNKHVTDFVRQYTDSGLTQEEIFDHLKSVHKIGTLTLNLYRQDDAMLKAIFLSVEEANIRAQQEANDVWEKLDELTPKFLKKGGGNFNILKQMTADGKETGRAVHRFSADFFEKKNQLLTEAFYRLDPRTGDIKKNPEGVKAFYEWLSANTISFDPRILFEDNIDLNSSMPKKFLYSRVTFNEAAKAEHIAELKAQLGEKGYEFYLKRMEEKIEKFKLRRDAKYDAIQLENNLSLAEKDVLFEEWLKEYSPYWGVDMIENPVSREAGKDAAGKKIYYSPKGLREYVEQVPRKTVGGKDSGWYDKNFAKIEADADLLEYHTFMMETLNSLRYTLPAHQQKLLGVGVLPSIQKSLMDIFQEKGLMMGIVPFWDKMKQLQTTTDLSQTIYSDIDLTTGEIEKKIQIQYLEDTDARVNNLVREMKARHKQQTGKPATPKEKAAFKREARNTISKEKSWDVTKILKAWSLTVMAHKHKSFIEPQIRLASQAFKSRKELNTNNSEMPQYDAKGNIITKEGNDNLKSALDYTLDSIYWGTGARKVEGVTKTKLYTKAEEQRKKDLEDLLKNEEDEETKQFLQNQIDSLGGFRTLSGTGDAVLKYMTLKGLGYNFFSAASNVGIGFLSNLIQASDGRFYSMENFRKASLLVTNSIGRNISFSTWKGVNGNALKIRTLMDKWDLMKTSNQEMYETSADSSFSKLKRFGPFSLQERSEYLNIAPIMVSVMLDFKAKDSNGNEVTLWDAYDVANGKLKDGYTSDVDEIRMIQKVKRIVELTHGDYNNPLPVKQTIAGRALSQFRTWMFEGFAERFQAEDKNADYALSYGMDKPYIRKGRYRSYTAGQLATAGATLGTAFLPGIGTAIGAGAGYLGGKIFGMQEHENAISDILFTLKQLVRKLMFKPTQFQEKFNATDAANMRKNMTELYIVLVLTGISLLLRGLVGEDDDDEALITNFLLNQTIRLQTDIGFYTNPLEAEKLTKTALPMASLIQDVSTLLSDVGNHFGEDATDKSIFESGPFKGNPKWLIHLGEFLPGSAQGIRLYRTGTTVMD